MAKTTLIDRNPELIFQLVGRSLTTIKDASLPSGSELELDAEHGPETFIWVCMDKIADFEQLCSWVSLLEEMDVNQLERVFDWKEADDLCVIAANKPFLWEFAKAEESQEWQALLDLLDEFRERTEKLGLTWLSACIQYTKMIVLSEHLNEFEKALELAEKELDRGKGDARIEFLIRQYIGRQYYYGNSFSDARNWLLKALDHKTHVQKESRVEVLLCLSHIDGEQGATEGAKFAGLAVELTREHEGEIHSLTTLKARGEFIIAQWLAGDHENILKDIENAYEELLQTKRNSAAWKTIAMQFLGCYSGIIGMLAKSPPVIFQNKQVVIEPPRGTFIGWKEDLAGRYTDGKEYYISAAIANIAEYLKEDDIAVAWALRTYDGAKTLATVQVSKTIIAHKIIEGPYEDAIQATLTWSCALAVMNHLVGQKDNVPYYDILVDDQFDKISDEDKRISELLSLGITAVLLTCRLMHIRISNPDRAMKEAKAVTAVLRKVKDVTVEPRAFEEACLSGKGV